MGRILNECVCPNRGDVSLVGRDQNICIAESITSLVLIFKLQR